MPTRRKPGSAAPLDPYQAALGGRDPIRSMAGTVGRIRRAIAGLSEAQLSERPGRGKWSMKEVVCHLADGEVILGARIRLVGAHDHPTIPVYDQEAFVARLGANRATTRQLLEQLDAARRATLGVLARLPPRAWSRTGHHPERGEESIRGMVAMYAGHDRIHEAQIRRTRRAIAPPKPRRKARRA